MKNMIFYQNFQSIRHQNTIEFVRCTFMNADVCSRLYDCDFHSHSITTEQRFYSTFFACCSASANLSPISYEAYNGQRQHKSSAVAVVYIYIGDFFFASIRIATSRFFNPVKWEEKSHLMFILICLASSSQYEN